MMTVAQIIFYKGRTKAFVYRTTMGLNGLHHDTSNNSQGYTGLQGRVMMACCKAQKNETWTIWGSKVKMMRDDGKFNT